MAYIYSLSKRWRTYSPLYFVFIFICINTSSRAYYNPVTYLDGTSLTVCWTATGDDGQNGKAAHYDIRYSQTAPQSDTLAWWEQCQQATNEPAPAWPGERQCMTIDNIEEGAQYYIALKVYDEAGNASPLSNIASTILEYYACADVDGDGWFSVLDIIYLIQSIYKDGPPPMPETGDINGDGHINILDILNMIDFRFKSGPAPVCL